VKDLRPGELVGGAYRVEAPLGRGGYGAVFSARELATGRRVALKVLTAVGRRGTGIERFRREAELASSVGGAGGVVRLHAAGEDQGRLWIAMELVDGRDLEAAFAADDLAPAEVARVLARVARTVAACHAKGVVHRDLKPGNVLLTPEGEPRLVDFGLARCLALEGDLTTSQQILGTPSYMAPEQFRDARSVGPSADVYALGAILYHGLCGQPPYGAATLQQLAARVFSGPPRPPGEVRPGAPADLAAIALRAMAREPGARYASAAALADDLERAARGERPVARSDRASRRRRRAAALAAVVAAALVATALGVRSSARRAEAAATLAELREWDGLRCASEPGACAGGAHRLTAWALGLGPGEPPAPDALAQRIDRLAAARPHLATADAPAADALLARLEAARARAGGAPAAGLPGPTGRVLAALAAADAGDLARAEELAASALAAAPDLPAGRLLALRLRAEVEPAAFLATEPQPWSRAVLRELAPAALERAVAARAGPGAADAAAQVAAVAQLVGDARACGLDEAATAAAVARGLDAVADDWRAQLAGLARPADRIAACERLVLLASTAPGEPRLAPAARAVVAEEIERLVVAPLQARFQLRTGRNADVAPPLARLRRLAQAFLRAGLELPADVAPDLLQRLRHEDYTGEAAFSIVVACLRRGVLFDDDHAFGSALYNIDRAEVEGFVAAHPESQRARWLALALHLFDTDEGERGPPTVHRDLAEAAARVAEGRIVDLHPRYLGEAHLRRADDLQALLGSRAAPEAASERAALAREALASAERGRALCDRYGLDRRALVYMARSGRWLPEQVEVLRASWSAWRDAMRRRAEAAGFERDVARSYVDLLADLADELHRHAAPGDDAFPADSRALLREAVRLCERLPAIEVDETIDVRWRLARAELTLGDPEAAEAALAPALPEALEAETSFVRLAVFTSLARGRPEEAAARLERARATFGAEHPALRGLPARIAAARR